MRRRRLPEAIGLTVLDLICGFFGLLVVLYAITERVDGRPGIANATPRLVRFEIRGGHSIEAGLEIVVGGRSHRSWPDCTSHSDVTWGSCTGGIVEAMVESTKPIEAVRFMLLEMPHGDEVEVWVTGPGIDKVCTLDIAEGYRGDARRGAPNCTQA